MRYLFGFLSLFALGLVLLMHCGEADLCEGIDCNDNNECTEDVCNPVDGHLVVGRLRLFQKPCLLLGG